MRSIARDDLLPVSADDRGCLLDPPELGDVERRAVAVGAEGEQAQQPSRGGAASGSFCISVPAAPLRGW